MARPTSLPEWATTGADVLIREPGSWGASFYRTTIVRTSDSSVWTRHGGADSKARERRFVIPRTTTMGSWDLREVGGASTDRYRVASLVALDDPENARQERERRVSIATREVKDAAANMDHRWPDTADLEAKLANLVRVIAENKEAAEK